MQNSTQRPLIVAFVSDLMFTSKIANVVRHIDFRVEWVETAVSLGSTQPTPRPHPPGERLEGQTGALFNQLVQWQPALLLFDLTNQAIPWANWIAALKSSPATRNMPVICFGPHEDVALFTEARRVGADSVFARSRFTTAMPELLQKHANRIDYAALQTSCSDPLPDLASKGIALFNQGKYYQCHDDLEAAWRADTTPARNLYKGILQVGIALYQVERGNYRGAIKMLLRVRQWLDPLPDICRGVHIAPFRANAYQIQDIIMELGPEHLSNFDWALVEPIETD